MNYGLCACQLVEIHNAPFYHIKGNELKAKDTNFDVFHRKNTPIRPHLVTIRLYFYCIFYLYNYIRYLF